MEIERKFFVMYLPYDYTRYEKRELSQAYISSDPVIRIRKIDQDFKLTIKSNGFLQREEFELDITEKQFDKLSLKLETKFVEKTRYIIPIHDRLFAELDVYKGELSGLLTVEVEFGHLDSANNFSVPDWFGDEVTMLPEYSNLGLATNGLPKSCRKLSKC